VLLKKGIYWELKPTLANKLRLNVEERCTKEGQCPKGGDTMAYAHAPHRTLTLQASLEAVARLGEGYLLSGGGEEWTAEDLLAWLQNDHPTLLTLPVALVLSESQEEGGIFDVDLAGEIISDVQLYRIERRPPTVYPI
jgi:hypothetical protein